MCLQWRRWWRTLAHTQSAPNIGKSLQWALAAWLSRLFGALLEPGVADIALVYPHPPRLWLLLSSVNGCQRFNLRLCV